MHAPNENEATKLHIPEVRNETSCKGPTGEEQEEQYPPNHSKAEMCQLSTRCLEPALSCHSTQPVTKQGEQTAQHLHSPNRWYASTSHQLHQCVHTTGTKPCCSALALPVYTSSGSCCYSWVCLEGSDHSRRPAHSPVWDMGVLVEEPVGSV